MLLHLAFNSTCIIACLYAHHPSIVENSPTRMVDSAVEIFPSESHIQSSADEIFPTQRHMWFQLHCWDSPTRRPTLLLGFSLSESHVHSSADGIFSLGGINESNFDAEISHSEVKLLGTVDGTNPLENNTANLSSYPHAKSNILEPKADTQRRHNQF